MDEHYARMLGDGTVIKRWGGQLYDKTIEEFVSELKV